MEDSKPILITWGFDSKSGDLYMACYLELTDGEAAKAVKPIYTRAQFTNENVSLFHIPQDAGRKDIEDYVSCKPMRDEVLEKLQKAIVRIDDVVRKKNEISNSVDFMMGR